MNIFSIFLTALFVSMLLVSLLMRYAVNLQLLDQPDARKVHARAIPRVGGIGMVLGTVAAIWLWIEITADIGVFLQGILIIALFGILDDRLDLNYKWKFTGQLLAVFWVILQGDVLIGQLSLFGLHDLPKGVAIALTAFFLLGMTNAMNLSDGLDGLAAGLSLLSLACIMLLGSLGGNADALLMLSLAIGGAILGFLRFNTHPALVFMGDSGSQFLGFSLGVLSIWLTQQYNTALAPELPLMILGLPLMDTLTVMTQRILAGNSPFKPDKNHLHHKFLHLGFDHYEAVVSIYLIQGLLVSLAYVLRYESALVILSLFLLFLVSLAGLYSLANRAGWSLRQGSRSQISTLTQKLLGANRLPQNIIFLVIFLIVAAYQIIGNLLEYAFAQDIGLFGIGLAILTLLARLFHHPSAAAALYRLTIYTSLILATYAVDRAYGNAIWMDIAFVILAGWIAMGVKYAGDYYFNLTPSDFLVMFILLASAYLPMFHQINIAQVAVKAAVLLYGVEFILRRRGKASVILWLLSALGFLQLSLRSLL